ncbi:MAG: VCBS repeat-containing protein, partial [Sphingobacteriales bacterium]
MKQPYFIVAGMPLVFKMKFYPFVIAVLLMLATSCKSKLTADQQMVELLKEHSTYATTAQNPYSPGAVLLHIDSLIANAPPLGTDIVSLYVNKAEVLLQLGREQQAVSLLDSVLYKTFVQDYEIKQKVIKGLALAYLRLGERANCIHNHSAESCLFPIAGRGIHTDKYGSEKAIALYQQLLKTDAGDYESYWLLNIAYMTLGTYPGKVPKEYLINIDRPAADSNVKPFQDVAMALGLAVRKMAGGNITDDFDNDGFTDIIISSTSLTEPMRYFRNNRDGSFTNQSKSSGLGQFPGGLNMMQTDYNNDGFKDVFVLR